MMILASAILRFDVDGAIRIFKRDRFNHLSPNSAQTEAVAAGALNIQLGGTHDYFGKPVEKPTIGDNIRPVEYEDIRRTNQLLYVSATLSLIFCCAMTYVIYVSNFFSNLKIMSGFI
jgi:adenosylcobinamide-phosphate synthase